MREEILLSIDNINYESYEQILEAIDAIMKINKIYCLNL